MIGAFSLAFAHIIVEGMGYRMYMSVISGTSPTGKPIIAEDLAGAIVYASAYFGSIVLVPPLLFAGVVTWWYQSSRR